ncbi:MAG: Smr/MutS family protein [Desulfopila sp.]|jgi:hypothetical protein|nr:Smr/MutS family protein [Desulfopila sp.]
MEKLCEVCGNEQPAGQTKCRYCGTRLQQDNMLPVPEEVHRIVNLELGRPTTAAALDRCSRELDKARSEGIAVITIIHGYGASGQGGVIRKECRKLLEFYKESNTIRNYIAGENFSRKAGPVRALLRRLPSMAHNKNLNKTNKGITVVEL